MYNWSNTLSSGALPGAVGTTGASNPLVSQKLMADALRNGTSSLTNPTPPFYVPENSRYSLPTVSGTAAGGIAQPAPTAAPTPPPMPAAAPSMGPTPNAMAYQNANANARFMRPAAAPAPGPIPQAMPTQAMGGMRPPMPAPTMPTLPTQAATGYSNRPPMPTGRGRR